MNSDSLQRLADKISSYRTDLEADLEMERSVPEDSDITRNESTRVSLAYLEGAVEVLRLLPESEQARVLMFLRAESVDDLVPDLSKFDPWEGVA